MDDELKVDVDDVENESASWKRTLLWNKNHDKAIILMLILVVGCSLEVNTKSK